MIPDWFADLEPSDVVIQDLGLMAPMADAEDGEQPWLDNLPPPGELANELEIADSAPPTSQAA